MHPLNRSEVPVQLNLQGLGDRIELRERKVQFGFVLESYVSGFQGDLLYEAEPRHEFAQRYAAVKEDVSPKKVPEGGSQARWPELKLGRIAAMSSLWLSSEGKNACVSLRPAQ